MEKELCYKKTVLLSENYFDLGLKPTELVLLEYILFKFQCNKIIWLTENQKKRIAKTINVSAEMLESAIKTLLEKKYIKPTKKNESIYMVDDFFYSLICEAPDPGCLWADVLWQTNTEVEAVRKISDKESKELL